MSGPRQAAPKQILFPNIEKTKAGTQFVGMRPWYIRDLVRIQTLNLQSRNLVLYSVELRGQFYVVRTGLEPVFLLLPEGISVYHIKHILLLFVLSFRHLTML